MHGFVCLYVFVNPTLGNTPLTSVITVGKAKDWVPELVKRAGELHVGSGFDKSTDV
jgi:hypothetical protein